MDMLDSDVESVLVKLDDVPLDRLRELGDDPVLVHALRRVVAATSGTQQDTMAGFNNFL